LLILYINNKNICFNRGVKMLIDLTIEVTPKLREQALTNEKKTVDGHIATHFDIMDKEFPLEYVKRQAIVFNVSNIEENKIKIENIDLDKIKENMFVGFYTGFLKKFGYGTKQYFNEHPQLSKDLINRLLDEKISIIGIDFVGIRRRKEHSEMDQYCADRGAFIVENICNFEQILKDKKFKQFKAYTFPIKYSEMSGLPCRVVAEV